MEGARPRAPRGHGFNAKHAAKPSPSIHRAPSCGGRGRPPSMRGSGTRLMNVQLDTSINKLFDAQDLLERDVPGLLGQLVEAAMVGQLRVDQQQDVSRVLPESPFEAEFLRGLVQHMVVRPSPDPFDLVDVEIPGRVTETRRAGLLWMGKKIVEIHGGVTEIGDGAFSGCNDLSSVKIPGSVTKIGAQAFANCGTLKEVKIHDSVTIIEDRTFYGCGGMTNAVIPASVRRIGEGAFYGCVNWAPEPTQSPVKIMKDAFYACKKKRRWAMMWINRCSNESTCVIAMPANRMSNNRA